MHDAGSMLIHLLHVAAVLLKALLTPALGHTNHQRLRKQLVLEEERINSMPNMQHVQTKNTMQASQRGETKRLLQMTCLQLSGSAGSAHDKAGLLMSNQGMHNG